jgi:hypothetical protein
MQKHRIHKIENKHTKQENKKKKVTKNRKSSNYKMTREANNNEIMYYTESTYICITINK